MTKTFIVSILAFTYTVLVLFIAPLLPLLVFLPVGVKYSAHFNYVVPIFRVSSKHNLMGSVIR